MYYSSKTPNNLLYMLLIHVHICRIAVGLIFVSFDVYSLMPHLWTIWTRANRWLRLLPGRRWRRNTSGCYSGLWHKFAQAGWQMRTLVRRCVRSVYGGLLNVGRGIWRCIGRQQQQPQQQRQRSSSFKAHRSLIWQQQQPLWPLWWSSSSSFFVFLTFEFPVFPPFQFLFLLSFR